MSFPSRAVDLIAILTIQMGRRKSHVTRGDEWNDSEGTASGSQGQLSSMHLYYAAYLINSPDCGEIWI